MTAEGDIRVLGRFSVRRHGREIEPSAFGGGLSRTLVRILVSRRGQAVSRDVLIDALWPRTTPADAGASLNVLVNRARRALGDPTPLVTGSGGYEFVRDDVWTVDAEQFLDDVARGRTGLANGDPHAALVAFRAALDTWGGDPLPEDAYVDWAQGYRSLLTESFQECLEGAATAAVETSAGEAVVFGQRAVAADPLREAANLVLVRALATAGDQVGALAAFDDFRARLADELGLDPSADAFALQARVIRHEQPRVDPPVSVATRPAAAGVVVGFVGRDAERDEVAGALRSGRSRVAVIAGRSGAGKSRFVEEVTAVLGLPVISARAFAPERDEPFGLARSLLRDALRLDPEAAAGLPPRVAAALVDVVPDLEQFRDLPAIAVDPASARALVLRGALALLSQAIGAGAALAADDLQWADRNSLDLLDLVAREVPGVRLLLAYRPEEVQREGPVATFVSHRDSDSGGAAKVVLDALGPAAIAQLISDEPLADLVASTTDGTPFAIVEVLRALWERSMIVPGADGAWRVCSGEALAVAATAAAAGQRRAVERRLEQHALARRELLVVLALVGREVSARLLAATLERDEAEVLADLDALTRSELVRLGTVGWATAHDLVRETVADGLDAGYAARFHRSLLQALQADGGDPAELARHALSAGDAATAAEFFARGAAQRLEKCANEEAEALAELGLDAEPQPMVRVALLEARAEARSRRGDLRGARADLREAMHAVTDQPRRSRLMSRMAMLDFGAEDIVRAAELADLAIVAAGADPLARAHALAVGSLTDINTGRSERALERSEAALALFEQAGDAHGVAEILDGRAMGGFLDGDITGSVAAFDRVAVLFEDSGNLLRVLTPRSTRGHALVFAARPELGIREASDALELARTLGVPEHESYALWHMAEALSALGEHDAARQRAADALVIAESIGHRGWTATALRAIGIACEGAHAWDDAEAAFARSLALSDNFGLFASWAASRLALRCLARGAADTAARHVTRALREGPALAQYEARWAHAALVVARREPTAGAVVDDALRAARAGGHHASVPFLEALSAQVTTA